MGAEGEPGTPCMALRGRRDPRQRWGLYQPGPCRQEGTPAVIVTTVAAIMTTVAAAARRAASTAGPVLRI